MNRHALVLVAVVVLSVVPAPGVAAAAAAPSPTYVTGDVTTDTTWQPSDGPYVVTQDVTVARGATLTVEPGTTVQVAEAVTLTVAGSLVADGTAAQPVAFTTANPNPAPGSWETIRYAGGPESMLRLANTTVEYGVTGVNVTSSRGRIAVTDSMIRAHVEAGIAVVATADAPSIRVTDSRFSNTGYAGVLFRAAGTNPYLDSVRDVTVRDTTFSGTGAHGVAVWARQIRDATVADSAVSGTREAGVVLDTERSSTRQTTAGDRGIADTVIRGTTITDAGGDGVRISTDSLDEVTVASNHVRDVAGVGVNVEHALDVDETRFSSNVVTNATTGVAVSVAETSGPLQHVSVTVAGNDLRHNDAFGLRVDAAYVVVDRLDVRENTFVANGREGARATTPIFDNTVAADNVARGNGGAGVEFRGVRVRDVAATNNTLAANGASGLQVRATEELSGVRVAGNDAFDNAGYGFDLEHHEPGAAHAELNDNTVAGNARGVRYAGPTPLLASNNSVVFNTRGRRDGSVESVGPATGLVVENATSNVTFRDNDVYGHVTGLRSRVDGDVAAARNYWGAANGPFHATVNPDGDGNAVETDSGTAAVVPFDEEPNGPAYVRPTPALAANRTTVAPGAAVAFSAAGATDDGRVEAYHFAVDGDRLAPRETPRLQRAFAANGTHEVRVVVEDAQGVESAVAASVTVTVSESPSTATGGDQADDQDAAQTTTPTTTAPSPDGDRGNGDDGAGILDALLSIPGLLGVALYGGALAVGARETYGTMHGRKPAVRGRVIHAVAGVGVLAWVAGGLLGPTSLAFVGVGAAFVWGGLVAGLYVLATR